MGIFSKPKRGPDPEKIRRQEEQRLREEGRKTLVAQEAKRTSLRSRLAAEEGDEEEEIKRKRLFGE